MKNPLGATAEEIHDVLADVEVLARAVKRGRPRAVTKTLAERIRPRLVAWFQPIGRTPGALRENLRDLVGMVGRLAASDGLGLRPIPSNAAAMLRDAASFIGNELMTTPRKADAAGGAISGNGDAGYINERIPVISPLSQNEVAVFKLLKGPDKPKLAKEIVRELAASGKGSVCIDAKEVSRICKRNSMVQRRVRNRANVGYFIAE